MFRRPIKEWRTSIGCQSTETSRSISRSKNLDRVGHLVHLVNIMLACVGGFSDLLPAYRSRRQRLSEDTSIGTFGPVRRLLENHLTASGIENYKPYIAISNHHPVEKLRSLADRRETDVYWMIHRFGGSTDTLSGEMEGLGRKSGPGTIRKWPRPVIRHTRVGI